MTPVQGCSQTNLVLLSWQGSPREQHQHNMGDGSELVSSLIHQVLAIRIHADDNHWRLGLRRGFQHRCSKMSNPLLPAIPAPGWSDWCSLEIKPLNARGEHQARGLLPCVGLGK